MDPFDLDEMRSSEWWEVGVLPYGAVEFETVQERTLNSPLVQVTQVNSFDDLWICPNPWNHKEKLTEDMNKFYVDGEGQDWKVPSTDYCRGRHLMAATYASVGYHRVLIKQILSPEMVNVLYIDYGTIQEIHVSHLRLLHKKFLSLPAHNEPISVVQTDLKFGTSYWPICHVTMSANERPGILASKFYTRIIELRIQHVKRI